MRDGWLYETTTTGLDSRTGKIYRNGGGLSYYPYHNGTENREPVGQLLATPEEALADAQQYGARPNETVTKIELRRVVNLAKKGKWS